MKGGHTVLGESICLYIVTIHEKYMTEKANHVHVYYSTHL